MAGDRPEMGGAERTGLIVPKKSLPRIVVSAVKRPFTLLIPWDREERSRVDMSGIIKTFRLCEPFRQSPALFRRVRVEEYGTDIVWTDAIDMSADTLWRLAQEQSGDRCRDARCRAPPAQIRTRAIHAYGSYLGCLTRKRCSGHG